MALPQTQPHAGRFDDRWPAWSAAGLAFASAAVTLFWTLGGTLLLDTIGAPFDAIARDRSPGALVLGGAVVAFKATAGLAALALLPRRAGGVRRWGLLIVTGGGSAVLVAWGGASVLLGGLVLGGVIRPSGSVDEHTLRWHVFVWDLWFLVWGLALALAAARYWRRTRDSAAGVDRPFLAGQQPADVVQMEQPDEERAAHGVQEVARRQVLEEHDRDHEPPRQRR